MGLRRVDRTELQSLKSKAAPLSPQAYFVLLSKEITQGLWCGHMPPHLESVISHTSREKVVETTALSQ